MGAVLISRSQPKILQKIQKNLRRYISGISRFLHVFIQTHLSKVDNLTYAVALKEVSTREKPAILHNCVLLIRKETDNKRTTENKIKKREILGAMSNGKRLFYQSDHCLALSGTLKTRNVLFSLIFLLHADAATDANTIQLVPK